MKRLMPTPGFAIEWIDLGRDARCPPDPAYPDGIDLDLAGHASLACAASLPYPAPRCGAFVVTCRKCGTDALVTTAGRADDPRSVRMACVRDEKAAH